MNSLLPYIGGKSRLSGQIISLFPVHETYVEVFGGACWVFFRKKESRCEIINDLDSELFNFWTIIREHKDEFLRHYGYLLCSRQIFSIFNTTPPCYLTDIQRAVRYYYVQRMCYGGRVANRTFGGGTGRKPRINFDELPAQIDAAHKRLRAATIEHLPWQECLERYDRSDTFFYLDPPYFKAPYYQHNMYAADYNEMACTLKSVKGKFILSINDRPEMRECFADFRIEPVTLQYSVAAKTRVEGRELLIFNF